MAFVLKISCEGDVRRKRFNTVDDVTFEDINKMIKESYGFAEYVARYQDDEGDWCTLTDNTLQDALELSTAKNILRLEVASTSSRGGEADEEEDVSEVGSWEAVDVEEDPHAAEDEVCEAGDVDMEMLGSSALADSSYAGAEEVYKGGDIDMETVASEELQSEMEKAVDEEEGSGSPDALPETPAGSVPSDAISTPASGSPRAQPSGQDDALQMERSFAEDDCFLLGAASSSSAGQVKDEEVHLHTTAPPESNEDRVDTAEEIPQDATASAQDEELPDTPGESSDGSSANAVSAFSDAEKIQIVLAAFDMNGDERLNFEESNELQKFAAGDHIPLEVYQALCSELSADENAGIGAEALKILYDRYGTLDRDFEAALRKLGSSEGTATLPNQHAWGIGRPSGCSLSVPPLAALGLLAVCPPAAGALAIGIALARHVRS